MKTFTLRNSKNVLFAAVAALSFASMAQMAQAADVITDRPAQTVRYSDLNLNTDAGVVTLYNRIHHAAEQVCGNVDGRRLEQVAAARTCVNKAMAASVSAVGNTQLTQVFMTHSNDSPKPVMVASLR
jgi:UrcA family protein